MLYNFKLNLYNCHFLYFIFIYNVKIFVIINFTSVFRGIFEI
ncbi:hypothetical protein FLACOL7796_02152 [Flavobacterium collinsii]|uniref:Uncharacterized protein n=1 Tax=Flavobacterium collinsii TaxID=1114861 RepID=A0ABM8KIF5_9FLAO|nr:hypothetical protein FLACOL7796_02152 [Flavobacterium collinsii]